ncbi:hypothetical protein [Pseudomonas reactans]|uniref:hypothetical protein n=1 Tax=Pseudomonas reactans TaxID=117680 RepID=UPI0015A486E4|nr:hypothetical protein [Pseudomonas reactans]NWA70199.1 hypothetical protein [Pseudomonas reactans]
MRLADLLFEALVEQAAPAHVLVLCPAVLTLISETYEYAFKVPLDHLDLKLAQVAMR